MNPPLATGKQLPVLPMRTITNQEKKILELIGQGYSSGQIAYALTISSHTVESHRKNLLVKLDAKNAAELIRKAIHLKIISANNSDINHNHYEND
jgi:DNA-binding CsgD family transcriptional regulator